MMLRIPQDVVEWDKPFFQRLNRFLGAFAKLRKATISFIMSVSLSVHMEKMCFHCTAVHEIWYLITLRKSVEKIRVTLEYDKNNRYLTWRHIYVFFIISRSFLLRKRNISDKFVEEIKTHILCAITFSSESRADYVILWKNMVESDRP
jgi:hypothetical protein